MPQVPIIMPQLGESIAEATIVDIKVKPGDEVVVDQEIIDVETNKAVLGVTTPCKGKIDKITVQMKETYPVGAVLGYVEATEEDAARFKKTVSEPPKGMAMEVPGREEQAAVAVRQRDGERVGGTGELPVPVAAKGAGFLSPRVRARMEELELTNADLAGIPPTGAGNRVTIKDLENFLRKIENQQTEEASALRAGVAVEAEDGIMVPIIRSADKTSLVDLTAKYKELVNLARQRRISPDMQTGGIAAVSNFGTFGVEWGTPIPLPDQTLLLGLGMGKKVPSWDESKQQFVPKTEAQITLSFDHRSIDGGGTGRLLKRVIELLEHPKNL